MVNRARLEFFGSVVWVRCVKRHIVPKSLSFPFPWHIPDPDRVSTFWLASRREITFLIEVQAYTRTCACPQCIPSSSLVTAYILNRNQTQPPSCYLPQSTPYHRSFAEQVSQNAKEPGNLRAHTRAEWAFCSAACVRPAECYADRSES